MCFIRYSITTYFRNKGNQFKPKLIHVYIHLKIIICNSIVEYRFNRVCHNRIAQKCVFIIVTARNEIEILLVGGENKQMPKIQIWSIRNANYPNHSKNNYCSLF